MRLNRIILGVCLGYASVVGAQDYSVNDPCRESLLLAEQSRNTEIYTQCGFDEQNMALTRWSAWVQNNNLYQGMYELCVRYPQTEEGQKLCQKAIEGGNGPALVYGGDQFYDQKNYVQALQNYTRALQSSMLTEQERGHIAEKIGLLYLNPKSSYYNPVKGIPVLEKAADQRSALANNILGVYAMFGMEKQQMNMEKAFRYFWRAILLGCPNAEENLGLFHLVRQKSLTAADARQLMQNKIFTCQSDAVMPTAQTVTEELPKNCRCDEVLQREQLVAQQPYRLISVDMEQNRAVLQSKDGGRIFVEKGTVLPDGYTVYEMHKSAVVLNGKTRRLLNLAPDEICVRSCQQQQIQKSEQKLPRVKPYRLSFTANECSNLLYYAERLVDTKLPFVGKKECGFSGEMDIATQLLIGK